MASSFSQPKVPSSKPANPDRPLLFLFGGLALLAAILSPFVFVRLYLIPSGAMEDTLLIGDRILVRVFPRVALGFGDMVFFRYPIDRREIFAKRVIGLPGDRIRMFAKVVYRNGSVLTEPYVVHRFQEFDHFRDNLPVDPAEIEHASPGPEVMAAANDMFLKHVSKGEVVVPAGKYFVLGDNRDNSLDSRYWGFVDESDVIGKPILILYSVALGEGGDKSGRPKATIRPDRFFKLL
jgi:signal peptidase I